MSEFKTPEFNKILESGLQSTFWKVYSTLLDGRIRDRERTLLALDPTATGFEFLYARTQGELSALREARSIPEISVALPQNRGYTNRESSG